jgi:hypothetical protein
MNLKHVLILLGFISLPLANTAAKPKQVIIVRHGEKILGTNCLALQGLERAASLAYFFSGTPLYNNPKITHVVAARPHKEDASIRPYQTCTPIAKHLNLPLIDKFSSKESEELAQDILTNPQYENGNILICWSHGQIPKLVNALGGDDPGPWDSDVFDQVYMLTFKDGGKPVFQKFLQKLMFGDRETFEDKPHPLPPITVECPSLPLKSPSEGSK